MYVSSDAGTAGTAAREVAASLLDALRREHDALARSDLPLLQQSLEDKQRGLMSLEDLLRHHRPDADLQELLQDCLRQNAINGRIVDHKRRVTKQALAILAGSADHQPDLYGPAGTTFDPALARLIARS